VNNDIDGAEVEDANSWARTKWMRTLRIPIIELVTRPVIKLVASPTVIGADRLEHLDTPVIFVANHSSHLDTSVVYTALPPRFRHNIVVTAGADYPLFFASKWRTLLWSVWMNIMPIDRHKVSRKSIQLALSVARKGWNLVIYPEGTRGDDDYVIPFKPGAAYLSIKGDIPIVPMHIEGTRRVFTPYTNRFRPGPTRVVFGNAMRAQPGERAAAFNERVEAAVAQCADEGRTDWWSARQRAARGETPSLRAPEDLTGWRKDWVSSRRVQRDRSPKWPLSTKQN
jgi:1-acyl-sn-glycerol-3-phosphate acyltransferase